MSAPCPCCSGLSYQKCCKPYHDGQSAPTALALMRSRYSAYAKKLTDYIIHTTHPQSPYAGKELRKGIEEFSQTTQFVRLEIRGFGEEWVYFAAHLIQNGRPFILTEKSQFEKKDGRWLYIKGETAVES